MAPLKAGNSTSGVMPLLDCVGIELIIERLRHTLFDILSDNVLESPNVHFGPEVVPIKLKIAILNEHKASRSQDGICIERMIDMSTGMTNYRYYILKIRDFYCLPAFLATDLPHTTGYLKLEIENQIPHYYVFADQIEFQDVLRGSVYEFNIPKLLKAVTLNVKTKEINVFLAPAMLTQELYDQYIEGSRKVFPFGDESYTTIPISVLKSLLQETSLVNAKLFSYFHLCSPLIINNDSFTLSFLFSEMPISSFRYIIEYKLPCLDLT